MTPPGNEPARLIHAIWLGSDPTPALLAGLAALQALNPDSEVRLWRDNELDWLVNRDLFDAAPSYPAKANLARYEIIHRYGGFYVDADFEWRKPLDPRVFPSDRLVVAPVQATLLNNGMFGAPAGHPFMAQLVGNVRQSIADNPGATSQTVSGPSFFTREFRTWLAESGEDYAEVPRDLLYPYAVDKLDRDNGPWSSQVIGIHHWSQGRSRRATSRIREAALDAGRRAGVRRVYRFARQGLLTDPGLAGSPDERACARFLLRVLEGSDVYVELGPPRLSRFAATLLRGDGRVYSLDPALPAGTPPHLDPEHGPAEHYCANPSALAAELDALSHVRVIHLGMGGADLALRDAANLVSSGRVDFVLVPRQALEGEQIRGWRKLGAAIHGLGPTGGLRRERPGTPWCVLDARPIRAGLTPRVATGGNQWRLPQAYRGFGTSTAGADAECPACGGPAAAAPDYAGFAMIRCAGCTYLGTRDRSFPAQAYAEVYEGNPAYLKRISDARAAAAAAEPWTNLDRFKAKALAWLDDDGRRGRLLDVGCGPGGFLIGARGLGWDVEGVEPAPAAAAAAVELGIAVFTGTLDDQGAPAGPFDAITAFEVLEHVGDPVRLLRGMANALGPGGRIVMSMPNLGDANLLAQSNPEDVPPIHISFFTRRSLSAAATRAGLRVERVYTHPVATASLRNIYGAGWKYRLPREGARAVLGRTDGSPMLALLRRA